MQPVSFQQLIDTTGGTPFGFGNDGNVDFRSVGIDSRTIEAGSLFWAITGENKDGHAFVAEARDAGAIASVVQRDQVELQTGPVVAVEDTLVALSQFARSYRQSQYATMIGVTGSVGKTTTREMIHATLSARFHGTQSPRNFNNHIGVPLSLLEIEPRHDFAAIELAASHQGEIRELAEMAALEIGVVTAIGLAHAAGFGDLEHIANAKGELVESLPASGVAVLAGDDHRVRQLAGRANCSIIFVGEGRENELRATQVTTENEQITFRVDGAPYRVRAVGRHHLNSALAAIAIAREFGMTSGDIAEGLESFIAAPGRCQVFDFSPWTIIHDAYNANPSSMRAACELLRNWKTSGKKILVVGDMLELGELAESCHRQLGEHAAVSGVDSLIGFGQYAHTVLDGALDAGFDKQHTAACSDFDTLLPTLAEQLEPGDVILVKGSRAMRLERVVEWLRRTSENIFQGDSTRVTARAIAQF